jgi:hypothetical protein
VNVDHDPSGSSRTTAPRMRGLCASRICSGHPLEPLHPARCKGRVLDNELSPSRPRHAQPPPPPHLEGIGRSSQSSAARDRTGALLSPGLRVRGRHHLPRPSIAARVGRRPGRGRSQGRTSRSTFGTPTTSTASSEHHHRSADHKGPTRSAATVNARAEPDYADAGHRAGNGRRNRDDLHDVWMTTVGPGRGASPGRLRSSMTLTLQRPAGSLAADHYSRDVRSR